MMKPTCVHSSELWLTLSCCSTLRRMARRSRPRLLNTPTASLSGAASTSSIAGFSSANSSTDTVLTFTSGCERRTEPRHSVRQSAKKIPLRCTAGTLPVWIMQEPYLSPRLVSSLKAGKQDSPGTAGQTPESSAVPGRIQPSCSVGW